MQRRNGPYSFDLNIAANADINVVTIYVIIDTADRTTVGKSLSCDIALNDQPGGAFMSVCGFTWVAQATEFINKDGLISLGPSIRQELNPANDGRSWLGKIARVSGDIPSPLRFQVDVEGIKRSQL